MRILYDYQIFTLQRYGGISRYFVELASRLNQYPGTNARIVSPIHRNKFLAARSSATRAFGVYSNLRGTVRFGSRLNASVSRPLSGLFRPDIVHETYYSRNPTSGTAAKTVVTVHDMIEELFPEYCPLRQTTMETRDAVFRRADHLICISENTRADLIKIYGVNPDKVSVIYHGTSLVAAIDDRIETETPFFLYVGERVAYKNFLKMVEAFAHAELFKTHEIVCFGGGPIRPDERERMDRLKVPMMRVRFVSGDDALLARYYAGAEAFVYPSLYEGFGIPLLEAMQCGCPVLCSNASAIPEVAGDAAIYFNARDTQDISSAMRRVVGSPEERRYLIVKGRSRARQFSWDICARQTYAVYEKLLSRESNRRQGL